MEARERRTRIGNPSQKLQNDQDNLSKCQGKQTSKLNDMILNQSARHPSALLAPCAGSFLTYLPHQDDFLPLSLGPSFWIQRTHLVSDKHLCAILVRYNELSRRLQPSLTIHLDWDRLCPGDDDSHVPALCHTIMLLLDAKHLWCGHLTRANHSHDFDKPVVLSRRAKSLQIVNGGGVGCREEGRSGEWDRIQKKKKEERKKQKKERE